MKQYRNIIITFFGGVSLIAASPIFSSCSTARPIAEYHYDASFLNWKPLVEPYKGSIKKSEVEQFYFNKIKENPTILINDLCEWYIIAFALEPVDDQAIFDASIYDIDTQNHNLSFTFYTTVPQPECWKHEYYQKCKNLKISVIPDGLAETPVVVVDDCTEHLEDIWFDNQYWEYEYWGRLGIAWLGGALGSSNSADQIKIKVIREMIDQVHFTSYYLSEATILDE